MSGKKIILRSSISLQLFLHDFDQIGMLEILRPHFYE